MVACLKSRPRLRPGVRSLSTLKGKTFAKVEIDLYTGCGHYAPLVNGRVIVFVSDRNAQLHDASGHYEQPFRAALEGNR
jgi:hypothetical protein